MTKRSIAALAFAVGCTLGGFIGFVWHAPGRASTWADARGWATFVVVVLGLSVAAYELNLQRRQFAEEAKRNERRDDLLDGQLKELRERAEARARDQAEDITVDWYLDRLWVTVNNESSRPITDVRARIEESLPGGGTKDNVIDDWYLVRGNYNSVSHGSVVPAVVPKELASGGLSGREIAETARLVIRFKDDAGRRWQLNQFMHLEQQPDDDW